jgi:hypothetical protein
MPSTSTDLFQEWRVAHRAATAAEKAMLNASIRALEGKGEPPSQAEAQAIRRLRAVADDLFQQAMAQMGEMAVMARTAGNGVSRATGLTPAKLKGTQP